VPKGVVLVCNVVPSLVTKLCAPYFIHKIPYSVRIVIFTALSAASMLVIALTPPLQDSRSIAIKMVGVMLASLSSGAGELSFLGLTHFYGHWALASWGSGTGGAGMIGAGAYALATNTLGIEPRKSLLVLTFLPWIMVVAFFVILPMGLLRAGSTKHGAYEAVGSADTDEDQHNSEQEGLLSSSLHSSSSTPATAKSALTSFRANLNRARGLFIP
jgi:battenin